MSLWAEKLVMKSYLVESNGVEHEAKVHPRDRHIGNQ